MWIVRTTLGYGLAATQFGSGFVEPATEAWFHRSRLNQFNAHDLNHQVYGWFNRRSDRPFLLFVQYNDTHDPYEVPSAYDHLYGQTSAEIKSHLPAAKLGRFDYPPETRKSLAAAYDNALNYTDSQMGELLRFLERSPEWRNTYVIVTADHGEAFGEHHSYSHGWDLYREVLHVPLLIVGPGIPTGVRVTGTAPTRQIFETILELAGAKGAALHQSSLSRLCDPRDPSIPLDPPTLSEVIDPSPGRGGMMSVTTHEWHFIYSTDRGGSKLYHWPTDPLEQHDVSSLPENHDTVERLTGAIFSIVHRSYPPWRDRRYLEALSGPGLPDLAAMKPPPPRPGSPPLPPGAGAAQFMFPQNPETPRASQPDEELLKSLPYGNEP